MGLLEKYLASKDVLKPKRYDGKTIQNEKESHLDRQGKIKKYDGKSIHNLDESRLDIKGTPKKYHP